MKFIIVETSVWSRALRKKKLSENEKKMINYLSNIIRDGRVIMIGAIRQEILCGISDENRFETLKKCFRSILRF